MDTAVLFQVMIQGMDAAELVVAAHGGVVCQILPVAIPCRLRIRLDHRKDRRGNSSSHPFYGTEMKWEIRFPKQLLLSLFPFHWPSPMGDHLARFQQVSDAAKTPAGLSNSPLQEQDAKDNDVYASVWNIESSRWAYDTDLPAEEGEIMCSPIDGGIQKKRKKMPLSVKVETRVHEKSISPDFGEFKGEGRMRLRNGSSEPDEGGVIGDHGISPCRNHVDKHLDNKDSMVINEESSIGGGTLSYADAECEHEHVSRDTSESVSPTRRSVNMRQGCRLVDEYERINKIGEGTYGVVYRAKDKETGEIVALKKVKMEKAEGFPLTSLREINILASLDHPSIVGVKEVVMGSSLDSVFIVMEYMEHEVKALMKRKNDAFSQSEVKCLMLQLLEGVKYLHDNWVLHRDLKTSNLLLNNRGELKICDCGMARLYGSPMRPYTQLVVSLWYRAPELLLGAKLYSTAVDMWSLGCIMAELLSKKPLFDGRTEFDQIDKIFRTLGTPNEMMWPGFSQLSEVKLKLVKHHKNQLRKKFPATSFTGSPVLSNAGFDLLSRFLAYDPKKRITAETALNHEWFHEVPLPNSKLYMPTFPAQ